MQQSRHTVHNDYCFDAMFGGTQHVRHHNNTDRQTAYNRLKHKFIECTSLSVPNVAFKTIYPLQHKNRKIYIKKIRLLGLIFRPSSVANLVSEILDLVSPKDFGMTQYLILFSISLSIQEKPTLFLVYGALVNLVSEKHNFSSWLRRELATLRPSQKYEHIRIKLFLTFLSQCVAALFSSNFFVSFCLSLSYLLFYLTKTIFYSPRIFISARFFLSLSFTEALQENLNTNHLFRTYLHIYQCIHSSVYTWHTYYTLAMNAQL